MLIHAHTAQPRLDLDGWADDFFAFHARFADLFARSKPRQQMAKYLRGLLTPLPRHNGWQMAEAMGQRRPDRMQRLLATARWDPEVARDRTEQFVAEQLGDRERIAVLDETGFLKDGDQSVGVQRQYSGTAGKVENCQIAVLLGYQGRRGHALLDRRLYLPQSWCDDPVRRKKAHVPASVSFWTKPQLGEQMVRHALEQGVPIGWVTGDEVYGDNPNLRQSLEELGLWYALAVAKSTPAYAQASPSAAWQTVEALIAAQPPGRWRTLVCHVGEKGPIRYAWTRRRVRQRHHGRPGRRLWLLARKQLQPPFEIAYYLCLAPKGTSLGTLARVASSRAVIEQCIREAKGDTGMDQYEVRTWPAWHRHLALSLMAYAWLASVRQRSLKKRTAGAGRTEHTRSATAAGADAAAASALGPGAAGMVPLAPDHAHPRPPQSLAPPTSRSAGTCVSDGHSAASKCGCTNRRAAGTPGYRAVAYGDIAAILSPGRIRGSRMRSRAQRAPCWTRELRAIPPGRAVLPRCHRRVASSARVGTATAPLSGRILGTLGRRHRTATG